MPVVFRPNQAVANLTAMAQVQKLDLDSLNPELPISSAHMVMAYAYALGAIGVHIGVGEGEVAPDQAMRALNEGIAQTAAMARKDLAEQTATTLPSDGTPG